MAVLKKLLEDISCELIQGSLDVEITGSCIDSRKAKKGFLFFAVRGNERDGASFIADAISRGAAAVFTDSEDIRKGKDTDRFSSRLPVLYCNGVRDVMGRINSQIYGDPSLHLDMISVTGTNGKTTTVFLIDQILKKCQRSPGVISTLQYSFAKRSIPSEMTTPDNPELFDLLSQMIRSGCDTSIIEVSSQASHQKRTAGISFNIKVFTNLSQDHLDYHETMKEYQRSKETFLFDREKNPVVLNIDDAFGKKLHESYSKDYEIITYGINNPADFQAIIKDDNLHNSSFLLKTRSGEWDVSTCLRGTFNIYNILAAISAASFLGIAIEKSCEAIRTFKPPKGRLTEVSCKANGIVFVDYAHTPDALRNVLQTLRKLNPKKLFLCFGCGGDRDKGKREKMGKIASLMADVVFITNDNPRKEDPDEIISAIVRGAERKNYRVEKDRRKAIKITIESLESNDIALIAGKGHENYQIIGSQYIPFSDIEIVKEICRDLKN